MLFRIKISSNIIKNTHFIRFLTTSRWSEPTEGEKTNIEIYNCITKSKVPLTIENKSFIKWYTCGPTVYDSAHIGHACTYVRLDVIQRILKDYFNYNIVTVTNITDIDDKIIKKCNGSPFQPLVKKYETEFWNDLNKLGINKPNVICRVTETIPQIISFISQLLKDNKAYVTSLGNIYFDLGKYSNYSKLQNISKEVNLVDKIDPDKLSPEDFALWKATKIGEPYWDSPWGQGRPGWHIECSVMASMVFGQKIDIHAGGLDLKFPHHENEEAISCSYHNVNQWVNYWLHTGSLTLPNSEKMSKSLKNTISIDELLDTYTSNEFRIACLITHYRQPIEFCPDRMKTAQALLSKFVSFFDFCDQCRKKSVLLSNENRQLLETNLNLTTKLIRKALEDDFDTPKVFKSLINVMSVTYKITSGFQQTDNNVHTNIDVILATENLVNKILRIFGIEKEESVGKGEYDVARFENILDVVATFRYGVRQVAKESSSGKLYKLCDQLRNDLFVSGIQIKDEKDACTWKDSKKKI